MPRPNVKQLYERIRPYIEEYARKYYSGDQDKGFRDWAFHEKFLEHDLSDTDLTDKTAIDGSDDFEVDGYHIEDTEEEKVIHLFQSKYRAPGTTMGAKELIPFLEAPDRLLNTQLIAACRNEETKILHDNLVKLIPQGYSMNLTWVTSGTLSPQARLYAEQNAARTMQAQIRGATYEVKISFEACDLRDMVALFQSHLESDDLSLCNFVFDVRPEKCHEVIGDYRTLVVTLPAKQIIDVFGRHSHKIFRLNPRGPLGNKVNTGIKATLQDGLLRRMFHVLNNGLSAICESYRMSGTALEVRDFQIVNGCQTTVTLWSVRSLIQNDPEVLVNLKLVECPPHFHSLISRTANTQAPLRAEDFISTGPIQVELQRQFDSLSPPWFYQIKRSEWSRMLGGPQQKKQYLKEDGTYRWLKSKDVAQALVAFMGFPGEAKDKIRFFFEGSLSSEFGELSYKDIYTRGLSATQLLLPALIYENVTTQVNQDKSDARLGPGFDWLEYARLHLLWLIGELSRARYRLERTTLFPRELANALMDSVDNWRVPMYQVARAAIKNTVDQSRQDKIYRGHREFFRSPANYRPMIDKLPLALDFARQLGADPLSRLPSP